MADQLDNRPVFTIVMGCNGAGKSAWDEYVSAEIDKSLAEGLNFRIESTYSGRPGPELVGRAVDAGYRIEGIYIGTAGPEVNIERIRTRVENQTGHWVDARRVPDRYRHSLHNLRQTADQFDELTIVDNTPERDRGIPDPSTELVLEKGRTTYEAADPATWVATWKERFETSMESRRRWDAKAAHREAQAPRAKVGYQANPPANAPSGATGAADVQSRDRSVDDETTPGERIRRRSSRKRAPTPRSWPRHSATSPTRRERRRWRARPDRPPTPLQGAVGRTRDRSLLGYGLGGMMRPVSAGPTPEPEWPVADVAIGNPPSWAASSWARGA